jgi:tRNA(Glu) U13 pseudouridine synthase TruD
MLCYMQSKGPCLITGVVSRDVVASSLQDVVDAAEALKTKGFVNYFGLQRFGAGVNATHQ